MHLLLVVAFTTMLQAVTARDSQLSSHVATYLDTLWAHKVKFDMVVGGLQHIPSAVFEQRVEATMQCISPAPSSH